MRWDRQNLFVIAGFVYTSTGLSNVVRYNGVFVIAGSHCSRRLHVSRLEKIERHLVASPPGSG